MDELIERLREEADGYGHGPTMFTNGEIAELRSLLREAAAALEAAREDAEPSHIRAVAKRNLRSLIKGGSSDKALMLACLEELS